MSTKEPAPRIYVASLSDYNAGTLHGRWIHAAAGVEQIRQEIEAMLAESREGNAEEWAIHDYEEFGTLRLSEFEDIESVAKVAELIVGHGPVFAGLVSHFGGLPEGLEEASSAMEHDYCGEFRSIADYAAHLVEECSGSFLKQLPEFVRYHIDYEGIANDMQYGGEIFTVEVCGKIHVFWSR